MQTSGPRCAGPSPPNCTTCDDTAEPCRTIFPNCQTFGILPRSWRRRWSRCWSWTTAKTMGPHLCAADSSPGAVGKWRFVLGRLTTSSRSPPFQLSATRQPLTQAAATSVCMTPPSQIRPGRVHKPDGGLRDQFDANLHQLELLLHRLSVQRRHRPGRARI